MRPPRPVIPSCQALLTRDGATDAAAHFETLERSPPPSSTSPQPPNAGSARLNIGPQAPVDNRLAARNP